jgi:spore coat polysaccharide biosynthesis protein SpsF (cytidylyltransferase family)
MVKAIYAKRDKKAEGILLMDEILKILEMNPDISMINSQVKRSTMYQ